MLPALRSPFSSALRKPFSSNGLTPAQRAIALLRSLGTSAHVWLPGANGVNVASLPSNNYLLSAGSTGYSTVDGVDGLTLDGMGALSSTELVTNGTFDSGITGWTAGAGAALAVVSGELEVAASGAGSATGTQTLTVVIGKTYVVTGSFRAPSANTGSNMSRIRVYDTPGLSTLLGSQYVSAENVTQAVFFTFVATATNPAINLDCASSVAWGASGDKAYFDNISVKEYTGTHLTQATTANKPLVRRGMLNLIYYSQDFTVASWVKGAGVSVAGTTVTGLSGSAYGAANTTHNQTDAVIVASTAYTLAALVSAASATTVKFRVRDQTTGSQVANTVALTTTPTLVTVAITSGPATSRLAAMFTDADGPVTIGNVGVFRGSWTAAQILAEGGIPTTTTTAASNPSAGKYWWSFDGSNDFLTLGSVPFQINEDHAVIVGFRNQGSSAADYVFGVKADAFRTACGLTIVSGKPGAYWYDGALASEILNATTSYVPVIVTAVKRTNAKQLRVNGAQSGATDNTALSSFTATHAYVGGSSGATASTIDAVYSFDGSISIVIVVKGTLTDAELLLLERFAASVTPGAPVF